jgi:hypothetical protein
MNSSLQTAFLTSALALITIPAFGKSHGETAPETLSIHLYDEAHVPKALLRLATADVNRLFRPVGVRIIWEQPLSERAIDEGTDMTSPAFQKPEHRGYVVVRLMQRTPATVFPRALGYSLPFAHTGAHVLIFYDRVEALTQRVDTAGYVILGHAMAHEIAHVLLGSTEHSAGGLMEGSWTPASWRLASQGLLTFRREEVDRMRARLSRFQSPGPIRHRELMLASSASSQ